MKIKTKMGNTAVSEIVGAILLLAIAISVFSVIYMNVLSDEGPNPETFATIVGKMETGNAIFEHRRGEGISTDSKVIIVPRGSEEDRIVRTVAELLDPATSNGDNIWDIGERLQYPENLTGWKVEATIIDSETNSIVMWGTLQEGYVEPPFGMGGIWHFDETYWDGIPDEVEETSGNNNHGTAHGANTTADAMSVRSGHFNGINDYVLVKGHCSLNITDEISIEAWIKPQELDPGVTTFDTGEAFSYNPRIIHISSDIYAIVSGRGQPAHEISLMTVEILSNGSVNFSSASNTEAEITPGNKGYYPDIVHVADNCYLIAYNTKNSSNTPGLMKTINISDDGNLSNLSSEYTYSAVNGITPTLIKVSDDIFAVAYTGLDDDGFIKTINISSNGAINGQEDLFEFDTSHNVYTLDIINVSDDIFAVAYTGLDDDGFIKTINISSNGTINGVNDSLEFDTSNCYTPHIIRISNDIYAIVYRGSGKDGIIKTINITSDGNITDNIYNNTLIFESDKCYNPRITQVLGEHYAIVSSTENKAGSSEGNLVRIEIAPNGTISRHVEILADQLGFNNKFFEPDIIQISPMLTVVIYRASSPHSGIISVFMTGNDLIPLSEKGIVKSGSASLYANTTRIYASINGLDQMISLPIMPNSWNHVVLTYDRHMIRLYCNFDGDRTPGIDYVDTTYDRYINTNNKNLYFGYYFCGLMDEIGIFDHALTDDKIRGHQTCIGCYEVN